MDRVIEKDNRPKIFKIFLCLLVVMVSAIVLYRMIFSDISSPVINKDKIRIGTVKRGVLDIMVSGNGVVTAKDPEWIVSKVSGQVIKNSLKSGDFVKKGEAIVEMLNEDIVSAYTKSESTLRATNADFSALKFSLHSQHLEFESDLQKSELDYKQAESYYEAVRVLWDKGNPPVSQIEYLNTSFKAEQMKGLVVTAQKKLASFKSNEAAQLDAFKHHLVSVKEENTRFKHRMDDLKIVANTDGIIQNLNLKVGQGVSAGDPIAQIINPSSTYVSLSVPAIQAFKLSVQQKVNIDLNKRTIQGKVHRIDPNVKGTTVEVDVHFDDEVKDAKIGMFVNGTVFVQSVPDALYIDIPSQVSENASLSIYRVTPDGEYADLTIVKAGALSSNYLQIIDGLHEGDKVVLSQLQIDNNTKKIRLN